MSHKRGRIRSADEEILEGFHRTQPDYVPFVANRLGLHLDYADERCARLTEFGLLERVTGEAVYRVTELGERYLAGEVDAADFAADGGRATGD
ncbi:DUF2250 domain-containing protein [Halorussus caseinilyticus]|uniref:DUF2250 domain-containing protein n=1 Tax=Halorussus caseinilyticus TaxID=3034025 RepID=A0ABD5WME2_9EURY|nr:DUF2250 domain-containing protein [Halorussus sp. DT72]